MHVLIVDDDSNVRDLVILLLNSKYEGLKLSEAINANEAISYLKENSIDLIISDFQMPGGNGDELVSFLSSTNYQGPYICQTSLSLAELGEVEAFINNDSFSNRLYLKKPVSPQNFFAKIDLIAGELLKTDLAKYRRIHILNFLRFNKALVDIYIKINDKKFVKIINKNETYHKVDIDKFLEKGQKFLYIEDSSFDSFVDSFKLTSILSVIDSLSDSPEQRVSTIHFMAQEIIKSVGINENVLLLADEYEKEVLSISQSDKSLKNLLYKVKRNNEFVYEHSLMLSCISVFLLKSQDWYSVHFRHKVIQASFFHDVLFDDNEEMELDKSNGSSNKLDDHVNSIVALLSRNIQISSEVIDMVRVHHERPSGQGRPRGISNFTALTSLFVLSHAFVMNLYEIDFDEQRHSEILTDLFNNYNSGHFKKLFDALYKTLDIGP